MIKKTYFLLGILMFFGIQAVNSQQLLDKAKLQAESGQYSDAITNLKMHLESQPTDYNTTTLLADLLVENGEYYEAEKYYRLIPSNTEEYYIAVKNLTHLLKRKMQYEEVLQLAEGLKELDYVKAQSMISGIGFATTELQKPLNYEVTAFEMGTNTSDFNSSFYNNVMVFSSFRNDVMMNEVEYESNPNNFGHKTFIYDNNTQKLSYFKANNNLINNIGPVSLSRDGSLCAYIEVPLSENFNMVKGFKNAVVFIAQVDEAGQITSTKPFKYNEIHSNINSIYLSQDGSDLYFSSNREGGFGGFDIYVSHFDGKNWTEPQNLGSEINTADNEITPFVFDNTLYFASDRDFGLGGFDIFLSHNNDNTWEVPVNAGAGINSPEDDFFPSVKAENEIYFTSNRIGGNGAIQIYKANKLNIANPVNEFVDVPEAVSLDDLAAEVERHTVDETDIQNVSLKETISTETAFRLPEFDAEKVGEVYFDDNFLSEAHRVSVDELVPQSEVYFIQLASISSSKPNYNQFRNLLKYGNIYRMFSNRSVKIRLGYFSDRQEAEQILIKVRNSGYKDAFITNELLNTAQMELVLSSSDSSSFADKGNFNTSNPDVINEYKNANKYKVRLASYEDPIWFDVNKVKDLGRIEQWTKGNWIIFILAGYSTFDDAKNAQRQAYNRGFKTAEVVIDRGGILERIKQN